MYPRPLPRTTHILKPGIAPSGSPADRQAHSQIHLPKIEITYLRPEVLRSIVRFHVWRNVDPNHLCQQDQPGGLYLRQVISPCSLDVAQQLQPPKRQRRTHSPARSSRFGPEEI